MQYVHIGIQALVATVFLVSTLGKVVGRDAFTAFVASARDLGAPGRYARPVAVAVVSAEAMVCLLVVVPWRAAAVAGLGLAAALLSVFAGAIVRSLRRGRRAPCRCFGASTTPLSTRHVVRNLVLAALAVVGAGLVLTADVAIDPAGALIAVVAGITAGALVAAGDDIVDLFRPARDLSPRE